MGDLRRRACGLEEREKLVPVAERNFDVGDGGNDPGGRMTDKFTRR